MAKGQILLRRYGMLYPVLALLCILAVWSYGADNVQKAKDSEKTEQPNFAARIFNSKMELRVWVKRASRSEPNYIGFTPSNTLVEIPACWVWGVRPFGQVKNWDLLVQEINKNKIPGLSLAFSTDSDLKHLAGLTGLKTLNLSSTQVTDAGLERLKGLTELRTLDLINTRLMDAGLEYLAGLTGLQRLYLSNTKITDAGLKSLAGLARLQGLYLSSTQVTDAGLAHLAGLSRLKTLDLRNTQVTDAGMQQLEQALPKLYIAKNGAKIEGRAYYIGQDSAGVPEGNKDGGNYEGWNLVCETLARQNE